MANRVKRSNQWRKQEFQGTPKHSVEIPIDPLPNVVSDEPESVGTPDQLEDLNRSKKQPYRNRPQKNPLIPKMSIKNYTPPPMRRG